MAFKEEEIQKMMKKLDLSRDEAIQLLQDDEDDVSVELSAEQKKVVRKMVNMDRKRESTPRKRTYKGDADKQALMTAMCACLESMGCIIVNKEKLETGFEFAFADSEYNLRLIKHRSKKD